MCDPGINAVLFEEVDPNILLIKECFLKFIYCSNRFKDYTSKLPILLSRVRNFQIQMAIENTYHRLKQLCEELNNFDQSNNLLGTHIKKINEMHKLSTEFDNFLLFYSYQI
jgi:hypothetical protein